MFCVGWIISRFVSDCTSVCLNTEVGGQEGGGGGQGRRPTDQLPSTIYFLPLWKCSNPWFIKGRQLISANVSINLTGAKGLKGTDLVFRHTHSIFQYHLVFTGQTVAGLEAITCLTVWVTLLAVVGVFVTIVTIRTLGNTSPLWKQTETLLTHVLTHLAELFHNLLQWFHTSQSIYRPRGVQMQL